MVGQRRWKIPGQRTKHKAWGFSVVVNGKRIKNYRAEWTEADAKEAEAKVLLQVEQPLVEVAGITLGEAVERFLAMKSRNKAVDGLKINTAHLVRHFGEG